MKTKFVKDIFCFLILFLLLNAVLPAFAQKKEKKGSKEKISVVKKTEDERRKEIEAKMLQGKYQHDGAGVLMYIGTIESVPALLKVLEDNPPNIYDPCPGKHEVENPPPLKNSSPAQTSQQDETPKIDCTPKKMYICTYSHAIVALRKITGQNFVEYEEWKNWWENYQNENNKTK